MPTRIWLAATTGLFAALFLGVQGVVLASVVMTSPGRYPVRAMGRRRQGRLQPQ